MAELARSTIWRGRLIFVALSFVLLFFRLLPLQTVPRNIAGPDIIMAFVFYLCLRQPMSVPSILIAIVILIEDLFLQRPPGLYAALIIMAGAWLKLSASHNPDRSYFRDWWMAGLAILGVMIGGRVILAMALVPLPSLTLHLSQSIATIAIFPIVGVLAYYVLRMRPETLREAGQNRGRL